MPANLFTIPANDQSMFFLSQIFGAVGSVLPGESSNFMTALFLTINTIALTVGAIIVIYTTVVGLMMTAHEGEFLGKKWSGLWVPIRMVAGVASLFPAASGYSMIQVVIMWIIVQGIGAADTLWSAAVTSAVASTVFGTPSDQSVAGTTNSMIGVSTQMQTLFSSLVCEQTSLMGPVVPADSEINFHPPIPPDQHVPNNFDYNSTTYQIGLNGVCGVLTKCSVSTQCANQPDAGACKLCQAQNEVLANTILPTLRNFAEKFKLADSQYLVFYYTANQMGDHRTPKATGWIEGYCGKNNLSIKEENATCCVPPAQAPPPPSPTYCLPETPPSAIRTFPKPYQTAGQVSNGMSIGSNSELAWAERWAILPILAGGTTPPVDFSSLSPGQLSVVDFITSTSNQYTNALLKVANDIAGEPGNNPLNDNKKFDPDQAKGYGWITAGTYFYKVVGLVANSLSKNMMPFSVSTPQDEVMQNTYRSNYTAAGQFLQDIAAVTGGGGSSGGGSSGGGSSGGGGSSTGSSLPSSASMFSGPLNSVNGTLVDDFMQMLQGAAALNPGVHRNSPLLLIATFGQNLLIIAQVFYVLLIIIGVLAAATLSISEAVVLGVGNITVPLEVFKALTSILYPALYLLLGALMTMGALLGMYIPMIPYVVFTASVIGWFIAVIEAMIAAPIIALGIISPGGQSEVFGRAEPSVMIIFNLFLRPSLMVFGLLIAAMLANVVIKFICMGFQYVLYDVMTLSPGLVEQIIFIAIFASIIFTSINQVFTLIHHIPERILTYIGGQAMQYGEGQAAQAMKQAVEGAAGGLAQAGKGTAEAATGMAQTLAKGKKGEEGGGMAIKPPPGPPPV